jgi:hypothetical protein
MENNYSTSMQSRTDEELLEIIIDKRGHYLPEALAAADQEVYKRIKENPMLSKSMQEKRDKLGKPERLDPVESWKTAKWGVMAFCIILFMYEIISKNYNSVALVVLLNYFIAVWVVKALLAKGKTIGHPFVLGIFVSAMILIVRFSFEMVYRAVSQ